jgi:cyclomaltodextrinase
MRRFAQLERSAWFAIAIAICAACAAETPRAAPATNVPSTARIALIDADTDVWAFRIQVRGTLIGSGTLADCALEIATATDQHRSVPAALSAREFSAEVDLQPGDNAVQARCAIGSRHELLRSGVVHYNLRLTDAPVARATVATENGQLVLDGSASSPSEQSRAEIVAYTWYERDDARRATPEHAIGSGARLVHAPPARDGEYVYALWVRDAHGERDVARTLLDVHQGVALPVAGADVQWLDGAVLYGVLPPLYGEPPLVAARAALDGLAELGVSAIWLAPIFETLPDNFGYAVTDYERVRRDYGSEQDLARLVEAAHARELRVIVDLPLNHTASQHRYFVAAEQRGPGAHTYAFYDRDARGAATHYFDWTQLPNLNYDNPEVARFMIEVSARFLQRFDLDGFRLDAAWAVAARAPAFLPAWVERQRRIEPSALLIAEASARDAYYTASGFNAAYDWSEQVGHWAWQDVFAQEPGLVSRLHQAVADSLQRAPESQHVLRFLNNNDTGARFITRHGDDMTRVATAALLTLPGLPCLYTLDEVGAAYEPYGDQHPVIAPDHERLRRFHAALIHLRRTLPALDGAGFSVLSVDAEHEIYAYARFRDDAQVALIVLHFAPGAALVTLQIPARFSTLTRGPIRDAWSGETLRARGGALALQLTGWDVRVLLPDPGLKPPR